jgi:protein-S-isoprenylcysteine O-methyltransferase Ste14
MKGTSDTQAQPRLLRSALLTQKKGWDLVLDLSVGLVWALFAAGSLNRIVSGGGHLDVGLFVFNTLVAWSFVRRRPAEHTGALWEGLLAWGGSFLPIVGFRHATQGFVVAGLAIQSVALMGMIAALASLGRSFGVAPADRGLVRQGFYRLVRHPLYATELLFYVGYSVANVSWRNLGVFGLLLVIQVVRILREERIISGYAGYASEVRWRLVPLIW